MLAFSAIIGLYFMLKDRSSKNQNDIDNYLLAGRQIYSPFPPAMSLTASFMSAITVLGTPVEFYMYGIMFAWCMLGFLLVGIMAAHFFLPVIYNLNLTTSYEYLRLRFESKRLENAASIVYLVTTVLYCGIVIYAPALALEQLTGMNVWVAACLTAVLCIFYTSLGGLKAVIWTDVFQCGTIMAGFVAIIVVGSYDFGGISNVFKIYEKSGRNVYSDFSIDPRTRHSMFSIVIGCTFGLWGGIYCTNQSEVQRYLSCKTLKIAQTAIYINILGLSIIMVLTMLTGMVAYAYFRVCDPFNAGFISKSDQTIPYLAVKVLSDWPGLTGIYVAGVYAGSLSTISSGINSATTVVVTSFIKPHVVGENLSVSKEFVKHNLTLVSRLIAIGTGFLMLLLAFLASRLGPVLTAALSALGVLSGPLLGLFFLGMTCHFADYVAGWAGFVAGNGLAIWIWIGGLIYPADTQETNKLGLRTDGCNFTNVEWSEKNVNYTIETEKGHFGFIELYHVSYMYLGVIGSFGCYFIGFCVAVFRYGCCACYKRPLEDTLYSWFRETDDSSQDGHTNMSFEIK